MKATTQQTPKPAATGRRTIRPNLACLGTVAALLLANPFLSHAQVPEIMHYSGRLLVGNQNFNQTGDFKFALVNEDGTDTYWSHNGTSANGSEPSGDPIAIEVDQGLFSVMLGDDSLPGMDPIPADVFANPDVALRIWFRAGNDPYEQFVPDQRIASVGYAMMAGNIPDGLITTDKIEDGAITGPKLAPLAVGTGQLEDGAVTSDKIAPGAVNGDHIENNSIGSSQIANTITLETLNLGSVNWDGTLRLYAAPDGGNGGILNPGGALRGHLLGDGGGSELVLLTGSGITGLEATSRSLGGSLRLKDPFDTVSAYLGSASGGGDLNLFQMNGNAGVQITGDRSTYNNQQSSGGEITVHNIGGAISVLLDGEHNRAGRIEVRNPATSNPHVDLFAIGANGGGEARVKDENGATRIVLDGAGPEASLTGNGLLQLGHIGNRNLIMDDNEITAREGGREAPLYLNPDQGNVVIGRASELSPSVRLAVQSDENQDALRVRVAGQTKLYVAGTGQVGINTTNLADGYHLNVNGRVICEELVVQNSTDWPDYVFEKDYPLLSLEEVEASIQANGHLPNVPPARVVESEGISMGQMQRTMMEKIEELTLYVIQQQKQIKALEARLNL